MKEGHRSSLPTPLNIGAAMARTPSGDFTTVEMLASESGVSELRVWELIYCLGCFRGVAYRFVESGAMVGGVK